MGKSRCRLLRNAMLCGSLLSLGPAGAIELWTVGGNGFTWDEVGDLTGLTIEGSVLLPAVVDSTTNAADNLPLRRRGGSISSPQAREDLTGLVTDGSAETFWRVTRERRPDGTSMVIDLGAILPINRIRFYPRLSRTEDAHIIAAMAEPKPDPESFGEESFANNLLEWYEIGVANSAVPIADDVFTVPKGLRWHKVISSAGLNGFRRSNDAAYTILRSVRENLDVVVDFRFPLQHLRWVAIRALDPLRDWEIAEMEIYGQGFVRKAVYLTDILDFGQPISWGKLRWSGEMPPGTAAAGALRPT